jgi:hypothetical protein
LKIDVQGYEMFALRGAQSLLKQIKALEIELSFVPLYLDAPVFFDMMTYLEKQRFVLQSLSQVLRDPNSGQLLQVDGLFKKINA